MKKVLKKIITLLLHWLFILFLCISPFLIHWKYTLIILIIWYIHLIIFRQCILTIWQYGKNSNKSFIGEALKLYGVYFKEEYIDIIVVATPILILAFAIVIQERFSVFPVIK